ncbi:DUF1905 domain-containing protein [Mesorhizobium sp. ZC-5]|uniref:DUF1905 domain-containing protein n=1 Tax=Mesorhizobium sp. ZC-5 TaxID=2986066 RepID=UPI0021E895CB|nr:DUF1905 domain-containing protein [Mesorhizobium sp. ZC-5]MCV3240292.1 DUF1905 domain-containing protein [Mesorhizobium sp. ZC-5]
MTQFRFEARVIYWRGPSPFFFVPIPLQHSEEIRQISKFVTYGWGMIPVEAVIGGVAFSTSLFPKDGTYLLPLKVNVRRKISVTADDLVSVEMTVHSARR